MDQDSGRQVPRSRPPEPTVHVEESGASDPVASSAPSPQDKDPRFCVLYSRAPVAVLVAVIAIVMIIGGAWFYAKHAPGIGFRDIVTLELSGNSASALRLSRDIELYRQTLKPDFYFLGLYGLGLVLLCFIGSRIFITELARRLSVAAAWAAGGTALLDSIENLALWQALSQGLSEQADLALHVAAAAAATKFCLLLLAGPVALCSAAVILKRAFSRLITQCRDTTGEVWLPSPVSLPRPRWPKGSSAVVDKHRWDDASSLEKAPRHRYARMVPKDENPSGTGFCVSGGGIRSACVTLGALQSLREELLGARWLVAVSGGGYMAGAMQLALKDMKTKDDHPTTAEPTIATPAEVYLRGTVEEDHLRRHGKYIADGAREWLTALWTLLRGLLSSLGLLAATVLVIGLALSYFYSSLRLAPVVCGTGAAGGGSLCKHYTTGTAQQIPGFPGPTKEVASALWTTLILIGVGWLFAIWARDSHRWRRVRGVFLTATRSLVYVATLLTLVLFVIPGLVYAAALLADASLSKASRAPWAALGATASVVVTYLGALVAILWRSREGISNFSKLFRRKESEGQVTRVMPEGVIQKLVVWVVLLLLGTVGVLLLAIAIATGVRWHWGWQIGIPLGLILFHLILDQTWLSLHPFYRRRLATAFSTRPVSLHDGDVAAHPYDFENEGTPLSQYGKRLLPGDPHETGFPQVIFACAANLSGPDRSPPGRRAVSFTMSSDFLGGPDLGYVRTDLVEERAAGPLSADITVQAAMAISGAAFASAMGSQAGPIQTLLAISNARLGTWLPNPTYLEQVWRNDRKWWLPLLPSRRRLTYLLKEILGIFPDDDRLLFVTDGGHYDNLGLVELLRRRPTTAFCIDASGDSPPFPQTLLQATTLAGSELGIDIALEGTVNLFPGSADGLLPPLEELSKRVSKVAAVKGRITYPPVDDGKSPTQGTLIFAKAVLTPDMPGEILGYAQSKPGFPRDGTQDQWFTHDQFEAYCAIGRYIGEKAGQLTLGL